MLTLKKGKKVQVALSDNVDGRNIKKAVYTSGNTSVAGVTKGGKVTAKRKGAAVIRGTITLKAGSAKTICCRVKVK